MPSTNPPPHAEPTRGFYGEGVTQKKNHSGSLNFGQHETSGGGGSRRGTGGAGIVDADDASRIPLHGDGGLPGLPARAWPANQRDTFIGCVVGRPEIPRWAAGFGGGGQTFLCVHPRFMQMHFLPIHTGIFFNQGKYTLNQTAKKRKYAGKICGFPEAGIFIHIQVPPKLRKMAQNRRGKHKNMPPPQKWSKNAGTSKYATGKC